MDLVTLKVEAGFDGLRGDSQYLELLKKVGLSDNWFSPAALCSGGLLRQAWQAIAA